MGHKVHSGASGVRNDDALFFRLRWDWYGFYKKRVGTHYAKLLFLHPVGSLGNIVHSAASVARDVDTLFFMPGWDRYRFHKKHVRTRYA
jgi:hypothetical protein